MRLFGMVYLLFRQKICISHYMLDGEFVVVFCIGERIFVFSDLRFIHNNTLLLAGLNGIIIGKDAEGLYDILGKNYMAESWRGYRA